MPYNDTAALARALRRLIAEGQLAERGAKGRAFVARYRWERCFERELACYREILELRRRGQRVPRGLHERLMPAPLDGSRS